MNQELIETAARAVADAVKISIRPGGETMRLLDKGHTFHLNPDEANTAARAAIAAIHPTVTSVEELDALPSGSVVLCAGGKTGEGDGDQALIAGPGWAGRPRIFSNYRLKIVPEAMVNDYERITVLHFGGAA